MKVETIAEQLLFATLRIVGPRDSGPASVGTGFIVSHRWADGSEGPFLVTNKHVIRDTIRGDLTFTLAESPGDESVPLLGRFTSVGLGEEAWRWTPHPSQAVDIAVLPLAPVVNHLHEREETPYYKSIPTDMAPEQDVVEDLDAVEEVLFVGYPSGIYDRANNLPITRKGITATPVAIDYEGNPVFLIDASVFPGSSGSPVFIHNKGSWPTRSGALMGGQRFLLLGVLGRVYLREDDSRLRFEEITASVRPVLKTTQMIDLGIVYKARTVVETIEHLLRQRGELPTTPIN